MEIWILAALAGWCPTGWPRYLPWWWWRRWLWWWWWWWRPPIPDPEPGLRPEEGPSPEPWGPITDGLLGALGGVAAWALLGRRFGGDGGMLAVIAIGFLGGCVGLSIAETIGGLRNRRLRAPDVTPRV